jgi:hypothetical protein
MSNKKTAKQIALAERQVLASIRGKAIARSQILPSDELRALGLRTKAGKKGMRLQGNKRQASVAAAYSTGISGNKPKILQTRPDMCLVAHRELVGNLTGAGTTAFTQLLELQLNPGLPAFTPWLANIAQNWQFYRFKKLRFCYYTRTGSTTVGSIVIVPDYNPADAAPQSEVIASNYEDVQEDVPWKDQCCVLRPNAMHGVGVKKLVRIGALAPNLDINQYDSGNLWVFSVDSAGANIWGKLWVEYEVEFMTPQLPPQGELLAVGAASAVSGTVANPVSTAPTIGGSLISSIAGQVVNLQNMVVGDEYQITSGATVYNGTVAFGTLVGCTLKNTIVQNAVTFGITFTATASAGSITVTPGGTTTNPIIVVAQLPNGQLV